MCLHSTTRRPVFVQPVSDEHSVSPVQQHSLRVRLQRKKLPWSLLVCILNKNIRQNVWPRICLPWTGYIFIAYVYSAHSLSTLFKSYSFSVQCTKQLLVIKTSRAYIQHTTYISHTHTAKTMTSKQLAQGCCALVYDRSGVVYDRSGVVCDRSGVVYDRSGNWISYNYKATLTYVIAQ